MYPWVNELLLWFDQHQRLMPWRSEPLPYYVWVSEIMLQQTQVVTVIPYFERFISRFPRLEDLATADLDDVLGLWAGLGYYSRARNLHKTAKLIMSEYEGVFPSTYDGLQQLPGIGPYVAAAVVSIVFEVAVPVVDGNVLRVFARFWGIDDDIRLPKVRVDLFEQLSPIVQTCQPSQFNQAIMELGALVCTPKSPSCPTCPLAKECYAFNNLCVPALPYKSKKAPVPHKTIAVGIVRKGKRVLIAKRKADQMLGGLWEFPGGKVEDGESIVAAALREIKEETNLDVCVGEKLIAVNHAFSHFKITIHVFMCEYVTGTVLPNSSDELRWVRVDELENFAFPSANQRIISALEQSLL